MDQWVSQRKGWCWMKPSEIKILARRQWLSPVILAT
jgi:hypothetical protein